MCRILDGPKKSRAKRQSGAEIKHVATAKLLAEQKAKPPNPKNSAQGIIYTGLFWSMALLRTP